MHRGHHAQDSILQGPGPQVVGVDLGQLVELNVHFEQMLAFDHPAETRRLDDTTLRRRAVYVVETRPGKDDSSAYERVVTFVDKEKCVALRIELYERGKGLRKTLMVNPSHLHKKGSLWIPQFLLMEDLVDYTTTVFMVDSTQQDVETTEEAFRKEGLALPSD